MIQPKPYVLTSEEQRFLAELCAYCAQHGTFAKRQRGTAYIMGRRLFGSEKAFREAVNRHRGYELMSLDEKDIAEAESL